MHDARVNNQKGDDHSSDARLDLEAADACRFEDQSRACFYLQITVS
jgi:hypothetical protein